MLIIRNLNLISVQSWTYLVGERLDTGAKALPKLSVLSEQVI